MDHTPSSTNQPRTLPATEASLLHARLARAAVASGLATATPRGTSETRTRIDWMMGAVHPTALCDEA